MADIERMLLASEVTIEPEPADSETVLWCLNRYFDVLYERFDGGYSPANPAPAGHADFAPPNGIFLVAWQGGIPIGCGSLRTSVPSIGEI